MSTKNSKQKVLFKPFPGEQTQVLSSPADELLIGSVLGCGKSLLLLMMPTRYIHLPDFNALLLRSSFPELQAGLIKMSHQYYPAIGGKYNTTQHTWTFKSGATISFGFLDKVEDIQRYRGVEKQFIGYDELSSFSEEAYLTLNLWLRTSKNYRLQVVSTSNPGGKYGDWIFNRWKLWLDNTAKNRLSSGSVVNYGGKTRSCILLTPNSNPTIDRQSYDLQFNGLPDYLIKQLREGNWNAKPSSAEYFRRDKMRVVEFDRTGSYTG